MADEQKTYLINFKSNLDVYIKEAAEAKKKVDELNKSNEELKKSGTASGVEIEKSNAALREAQKEYSQAKKLVDLQTTANNSNTESRKQLAAIVAIEQQRLGKLANQYTINNNGQRELSQSYKDAVVKVNNAKKAIIEYDKAQSDGRSSIGLYSEAIEGAMGKFSMMPGPLGQAANGVKGLNKQFLTLLANPIVLLIAAIVAALVGLFKAFKSTDSGATELAARMEQLKAILDVIRQRAIALVGALTSLFKGDFKKAADEFKESVSGIKEQFKEATKAAYDYQKQLDINKDSEDNFISRSAEIRNAISKLEFTAQDRTKSTAERKKALDEAIKLGEEEVAVKKQQAEANLITEADYLARKSGLRAQDVIDFIKMSDEEQANAKQSVKTLRDNNESKFTEIENLYAKMLDADTAFYDENKRNMAKASAFQLQLAQETADKEIEIKRKAAEKAVQNERAALTEWLATNEQKPLKTEEIENKIDSISVPYNEKRKEAAALEVENGFRLLETTLFGKLDLEKQNLEAKKAQELAYAESIGAETASIVDYYAKAEQEIERTKRDAVLDMAGATAQGVIDAFGESSAIGKFAAVAMTTIDTFKGATSAFTGMIQAIPGPVGIAAGVAAAAVTVAAGLANVKKILSVKIPKGKGGRGGQSGGSSMSAAASHVTAKPIGPTTLNTTTNPQTVKEKSENASLTADAIAQAMSKVPAPVVTVEDINAKTTEKRKVEVSANI